MLIADVMLTIMGGGLGEIVKRRTEVSVRLKALHWNQLVETKRVIKIGQNSSKHVLGNATKKNRIVFDIAWEQLWTLVNHPCDSLGLPSSVQCII